MAEVRNGMVGEMEMKVVMVIVAPSPPNPPDRPPKDKDPPWMDGIHSQRIRIA